MSPFILGLLSEDEEDKRPNLTGFLSPPRDKQGLEVKGGTDAEVAKHLGIASLVEGREEGEPRKAWKLASPSNQVQCWSSSSAMPQEKVECHGKTFLRDPDAVGLDLTVPFLCSVRRIRALMESEMVQTPGKQHGAQGNRPEFSSNAKMREIAFMARDLAYSLLVNQLTAVQRDKKVVANLESVLEVVSKVKRRPALETKRERKEQKHLKKSRQQDVKLTIKEASTQKQFRFRKKSQARRAGPKQQRAAPFFDADHEALELLFGESAAEVNIPSPVLERAKKRLLLADGSKQQECIELHRKEHFKES